MARIFRPPVKRLERLLAQADRLTSWARVQAYQSGSSRTTVKPDRRPRSKP
jgi:hypothetical protein